MPQKNHIFQSILYAFLMLLSIGLGLASRRYGNFIPAALNMYLGDAIWSMMVYFGIRCIQPKYKMITSSVLALSFSFAIEISQLYQASWINEIRQTVLGGLILGFGFLWSDLIAYSIGVGLGLSCDYLINRVNK